MANWWKCKVVKPSMMIPFSPGEFIFAKNQGEYMTLFDGRQETRVPKGALRYLQLVGPMQKPESDQIQYKFEHKVDAQPAWDHRDVMAKKEPLFPPSPPAEAPNIFIPPDGGSDFLSPSTGEATHLPSPLMGEGKGGGGRRKKNKEDF